MFERLKERIKRSSDSLLSGLARLVPGRAKVDAQTLDGIEQLLLAADLGVIATDRIVASVRRQGQADQAEIVTLMRTELLEILRPIAIPLQIPRDTERTFSILTVGINGVGKTTTIAKLAKYFKDDGRTIMLAAGDTFRAAAVEQLQAWGERNTVPVIAQANGADSAAVIFDALDSARAKGVDVLIADTAGRLHTQSNLMDELKKIKRVMAKQDAGAPDETLLIVDATTGQNALAQAREFHNTVGVSGIVLTKLDGSAKGGTLVALASELGLPVRFIGIGESAADLLPFDAEAFIDALLTQD